MHYKKQLLKKIDNKKAKVGIVGLGYVGLPLAKLFSRKKFDVIGFEIDKSKVIKLKEGKSYINHINNRKITSKKNLLATWDFKMINNVDIIILCLPTPVNANKTPNLSYIKKALINIKSYLKAGQIIILESSTYPGSTREIINNFLLKNKFIIGKNFFLGYSPEREDPNNKTFHIENIPKLCSGVSKSCKIITENIYKKIVNRVVSVSSIETAEFTKVFENTYRSVNIALVNEMKLLAKKKKLNINEIIDAADTKPFGFQAFQPGPGVGGHCIPIDPYYLSWVAKKNNLKSNFVDLAGKVNDEMPNWIIRESLKIKKIKKALILGVAYKKNIDDVRESPALEFIKILNQKKIKTNYFDPYIKKLELKKNKILKSVKLQNLKYYDIIYIITDHDCIDYKKIKNNAKLIIDTRNVFKKEIKDKIIKL